MVDRDSNGRFVKGRINTNKKQIIETICKCGKVFSQPDVKYKQKYCSKHCVGIYEGQKHLKGINIGRKQSPELIEKRRNAIIKNTPVGDKSKNWKGGYQNPSGYIVQHIKQKMVLYHRLVFEKYHNTSIPKGYDIHHIDLNKKNNDITNLQCMPHKEHIILHHKIKRGEI